MLVFKNVYSFLVLKIFKIKTLKLSIAATMEEYDEFYSKK